MIKLKPSIPYPSKTVRLSTGCGPLYLTLVYEKSGTLKGILLQLGKMGGCVTAHLSILSRHVNMALDNSVHDAIKALSDLTGVTCQESSSCMDVVVRYVLAVLLKQQEADKE